MQKTAFMWSTETLKNILKDFFGLEDYQIEERYGEGLVVSASPENPAIYYDSFTRKLIIEYPNENEELPNPSGDFYPDIEREHPIVEAVKEFIKEELGEDALREAEKTCKNAREEADPNYIPRRGDPYYDCLVEQAYDKIRERLEKELQEEVEKLEKSKPRQYEFCGILVKVKTGVYEATKYNKVGGEYTAYFPSKKFIINLEKALDEETLRCALEKIQSPGEWWKF